MVLTFMTVAPLFKAFFTCYLVFGWSGSQRGAQLLVCWGFAVNRDTATLAA